MRFARVIPAIRTPVGVEAFDYRIPSEMTLQVGDLVIVPFRRQPVCAIVSDIMETSEYAARAEDVIKKYADIHFPSTLVTLLAWTAHRTFCSQPAVFKAWIRNVPKRMPPSVRAFTKKENTNLTARGSFTLSWTTDTHRRLIAQASASRAEGKRVLIMTPWKNRLTQFCTQLPNVLTLHGDLSDGEAFRNWFSFITEKNQVLVCTRLGAWLTPMADVVLIDEPENDDHKQDALAPRYDARHLALWSATNAGVSVAAFGLTPPLGVDATAPSIEVDLRVLTRHRAGSSKIPMMQPDTLDLIRTHTGPVVIVHPIRGMGSKLVCRDCGWMARCERCQFALRPTISGAVCPHCGVKAVAPETCPVCGCSDLGKIMPGMDRLKAAWKKYELDQPVSWRDLSRESIDAPLEKNSMVVVTDGSMLGGSQDDIRRKERRSIAFRRLADRVALAEGKLVIQSHESTMPEWSSWLTSATMNVFRQAEIKERQLFGYPPAFRVVKCILEGSEEEAKAVQQSLTAALPRPSEVRGPFPVPFRVRSAKTRFIFHCVLSKNLREDELLNLFQPFAGKLIIDLDPIAFFK